MYEINSSEANTMINIIYGEKGTGKNQNHNRPRKRSGKNRKRQRGIYIAEKILLR